MLPTAFLHKNKINISVLPFALQIVSNPAEENESIKRLLCFLFSFFAETALFINIKAKTEVFCKIRSQIGLPRCGGTDLGAATRVALPMKEED